MSQHYFTTIHNREETSVIMGWDKNMQCYFMVIEKGSDVDDTHYWSNLIHAEEAFPKTLQPFLSVLKNLGIYLPPQMIEEVKEDGVVNMGNKTVRHLLENGVYFRKEI